MLLNSKLHAIEIASWLYWNNYIEFQTYSLQYPDGSYDAGSAFNTVSSGLDAYVGQLSVHAYGIYQDGETSPAELERMQIAWAPTNWATLSIGQNYLPFSYIDTLSVSYAPTASLGLTFRENITLTLNSENFYFSVYTYKTRLHKWDVTEENGATLDNLDHYGADFTISFPGDALTVGASLLSNFGDSDLMAAVFPSALYMTEQVPVVAVYTSLFVKRLGVIIEAIEATKRFNEYDFYGFVYGLRPRATNLEIAWYASTNSWGLISYRTTHQAEFTGLSAESYVLGFTNAFYNKAVHIGFELRFSKSYSSEYNEYKRLSTSGAAVKFTWSF